MDITDVGLRTYSRLYYNILDTQMLVNASKYSKKYDPIENPFSYYLNLKVVNL